ncbi:MAG: hypothetical protein R6V12_03375, partial [Candidatus Hydrogenedentota bacterium]
MNSTQSTGSSKPVSSLLGRAFGWGEVFVLIPLHIFWVVFKSTPFGAENRAGLLVVLVPFGVMAIAGLAAQRRGIRAAFVRAEWLFHLTSAVLMTGLLAWLPFRDPFNPMLPLTWPLCIWSGSIAFTLLANLAMHERTRDSWFALSSFRGRLLACGIGAGLWLLLFPLAVTMAWVPCFWTVSALFHAIMAPKSRQSANDTRLTDAQRSHVLTSCADMFEGGLAASIMLLALLRLLFACDIIGAAEVRYPLFVNVCASPWFFAGVVLAALARTCRLALLGHALVVLTAFLVREGEWTVPAFMGYGLAVLFLATMRTRAFIYALLSFLTTFVWVLGLLGFMLAGVIIVFEVGGGLAENLLTSARMAILLLFFLWLFFALLGYSLRRRKTFQPDSDNAPEPSGRYGWTYGATWLIILLPLAVLVGRFMWPPVFFQRPSRITVGE